MDRVVRWVQEFWGVPISEMTPNQGFVLAVLIVVALVFAWVGMQRRY